MDAFILEWINLLLRWLHLITGIAWIGASFYFVWLDNSLEAPPQWKKEKGVSGDLWAFHGGGIYEVAKYSLAPGAMPKTLHWFKWEAYTTWITGSLLLIAFYYFKADLYLLGSHSVVDTPGRAILSSLVFIASGTVCYELILRSPLIHNTWVFVFTLSVIIAVLSWVATTIFNDRAAFLHVGAMLATIMAANVFIGIIPAQKKFIKDIDAAKIPDAAAMMLAKTRSVHNNYFTLPVLFCMISNHYSFLYSHQYNWLILIIIIAVTAYARHFFNLKHRGIIRPQILVFSGLVVALLAAGMAWLKVQPKPSPIQNLEVDAGRLTVQEILQTHCTVCHANSPSQTGFSAAPAGLIFETLRQLEHAKDSVIPAVESGYMPLANMTGLSEKDRAIFLAHLKRL